MPKCCHCNVAVISASLPMSANLSTSTLIDASYRCNECRRCFMNLECEPLLHRLKSVKIEDPVVVTAVAYNKSKIEASVESDVSEFSAVWDAHYMVVPDKSPLSLQLFRDLLVGMERGVVRVNLTMFPGLARVMDAGFTKSRDTCPYTMKSANYGSFNEADNPDRAQFIKRIFARRIGAVYIYMPASHPLYAQRPRDLVKRGNYLVIDRTLADHFCFFIQYIYFQNEDSREMLEWEEL